MLARDQQSSLISLFLTDILAKSARGVVTIEFYGLGVSNREEGLSALHGRVTLLSYIRLGCKVIRSAIDGEKKFSSIDYWCQ